MGPQGSLGLRAGQLPGRQPLRAEGSAPQWHFWNILAVLTYNLPF